MGSDSGLDFFFLNISWKKLAISILEFKKPSQSRRPGGPKDEKE
jgi:hypothetical protein